MSIRRTVLQSSADDPLGLAAAPSEPANAPTNDNKSKSSTKPDVKASIMNLSDLESTRQRQRKERERRKQRQVVRPQPTGGVTSPSSSATVTAAASKGKPKRKVRQVVVEEPVEAQYASSAASPSAGAAAAAAPAAGAEEGVDEDDEEEEDDTPVDMRLLAEELRDDGARRGTLRGEKLVMKIGKVMFLSPLGRAVHGVLHMSNYQLFFVPGPKQILDPGMTAEDVSVALGTVGALETKKIRGTMNMSNPPTHFMVVRCKDTRVLRFAFESPLTAEKAFKCLEQYVFPHKEDLLFSHSYVLSAPLARHIDGWRVYDINREFKRMGLPNDMYRITYANRTYKLCPTYPPFLVVPNSRVLSDSDLGNVARFRSRGRLPVLTWKARDSACSIWRCSQPRVGMNSTRSSEDERLVTWIMQAPAPAKRLIIYDCRPRINAMGNKMVGKGFEDTNFYPGCELVFMNIENIHVMRSSFNKLRTICHKVAPTDSQFRSDVAGSEWLAHLSLLMYGTFRVVKSVDYDKQSVVNHCSDGWDRTSQICALAQLCLDPYYRTTRGFFVLIEKDWLSFGHKFHERLAHRTPLGSSDQQSPIFVQFIDAVFQLTQQFPTAFEFNSRLLVTLLDHVYSCRFGTFLFNSYREREEACLRERTVSLWTYLLHGAAAQAGHLTNPFYVPHAAVLYPSYHPSKVALWEDYFLRWTKSATIHEGVGHRGNRMAPEIKPNLGFYEDQFRSVQQARQGAEQELADARDEITRLRALLEDAGVEVEQGAAEEQVEEEVVPAAEEAAEDPVVAEIAAVVADAADDAAPEEAPMPDDLLQNIAELIGDVETPEAAATPASDPPIETLIPDEQEDEATLRAEERQHQAELEEEEEFLKGVLESTS